MIGSADCTSARLAATRAGWHRVAEHILAPARTFRQVGTAAEAAAFFRDGRARVLAHAATTPTRRTS
jgi:hypothetical protein